MIRENLGFHPILARARKSNPAAEQGSWEYDRFVKDHGGWAPEKARKVETFHTSDLGLESEQDESYVQGRRFLSELYRYGAQYSPHVEANRGFQPSQGPEPGKEALVFLRRADYFEQSYGGPSCVGTNIQGLLSTFLCHVRLQSELPERLRLPGSLG